MKAKKVFSVLMAAAMMAGVMTGGTATTVSAADTYKVAFLPTDMSATFASWLASELQTAFDQYDDMELTVIDSKNELETQISSLETCVSQGYDYIILLPLEPAAEDDLVEGYINDGTPIMNINLDDLAVEKASSVIANPYDLGTVVAEEAKKNLPEDANVVVLLGPSGNTDSIERRRAYEDVLFSQNENITILDEQIGDWEKSKGMEYMENWLQVYDDVDAVISMNDAMAIGAYEAAKDAGVADDIQFYGVDGLADAAVAINDGDYIIFSLRIFFSHAIINFNKTTDTRGNFSMKLTQLEYFCVAARYHNITKAAKELFVTQPSISNAIKALEEEFGVNLFFRNNNKLTLTPEGELFYKSAEGLLAHADSVETEFHELRKKITPIRIGIPPMLGTIYLPELYLSLKENFPEVDFRLFEFGSIKACELVLEEKLDIAIVNAEQPAIDKCNRLRTGCRRLLLRFLLWDIS